VEQQEEIGMDRVALVFMGTGYFIPKEGGREVMQRYRYLWKGQWYYIDFAKDNLAIKFEEYESRAKTSRLIPSTGLKDCKGVEIFERDLVRYNGKDSVIPEFNMLVTWRDAAFYLEGKYHEGTLSLFSVSNMMDRFEVVGNEFQNPSLLKGADK
jgi:hypothetical protein